jgi:NitT/TauT family transport system ATP-binding protein
VDTLISVRRLCKTFEDASGNTGGSVEAIRRLDFEVKQGEFVSIIGPSGCGKSTLLDILGGLEPPTGGEVVIEGERVAEPHPKVAMVFQLMSVFPWRTALQNVEFGLELRGVDPKVRRAKAMEVFRLVGLSGFEQKYPSQLSGGMNQRLAIARALALDPNILLMDEPFGSLDEQTRFLMGLELLRIWEATRKTILFVTHSIAEAIQLSDRVLVMSMRPSVIREEVPIKLPRPRTIETLTMEECKEIEHHIWDVLKVESLKGLAAADGKA